MRFPARLPVAKTRLRYDVVISQNFGRPIDGYRARTQQNGGSELHTVLVAEALRKTGLAVAVIQPGGSHVRWEGVDYLSAMDVLERGLYAIECEVLVSQRFGSLPANVSFARLVVEMHDLPDERCENIMPALAQCAGSKTIVHSHFNEALYPGWPGLTVIPAMIEDSLYELPPLERDTSKRELVMVYGSAALKGLAPTLQLWREMHKAKYRFKKAKLVVTSPGYDSPNFDELKKTPGVEFRPQKTLGDMQNLLRNSDGIFMVNMLPETYGCVQTQCEVAGRLAWVMCMNGPGALKETLANPETVHTDPESFVRAVCEQKWPTPRPAKNVRQSAVVPLWLDALGFSKEQKVAA